MERHKIICQNYDETLTCQGFHEEQQTDRPCWKRAERFTFTPELKDLIIQQVYWDITHLSPPRIKAVLRPVNFPNYNTKMQ